MPAQLGEGAHSANYSEAIEEVERTVFGDSGGAQPQPESMQARMLSLEAFFERCVRGILYHVKGALQR